MLVAGLMTTDRFMVREFTEHDREAFIACQIDPKFSRFHLESERGAAHASSVFDLFLLWQREEPRLNHQLAVAPHDDPKTYLGNVGVRMGGLAPGQAELGIELIPSCWGNGAATEIMAAILPWATRRFGLTTFIAETAIENAAAEQLARKTGLRQFDWSHEIVVISGVTVTVKVAHVRELARLHTIPLLSQPGKRSRKLQLQTVQFSGIRSN